MTTKEYLNQAKPILFNTEMVQAILDGRKTQTRRFVVQELPIRECPVGGNHEFCRDDIAVGNDIENAIKKTVKEVTDNLKARINNEVKKQLGEKLADVIGLPNIIQGKGEQV